MGSMPSYFSVYPAPAKVPTNAAILGSKHAVGLDRDWTVTVLDGEAPVEVFVEPFGASSGPGATFAIRPAHGWPPKRTLEIVARLDGMEKRHPFETAKAAHSIPPRCEWIGPSTIEPKSPTPPTDSWPTNIPRPPTNLRTFPMPPVESPAGYMVAARIQLTDRGRVWSVEIVLPAKAASGPSEAIALTPPYGDDFSDEAQVIGMTLTDLAGNVARYGTTA